MGLLALIPLKAYLIGGLLSAGAIAYKCHVHGIRKEAKKEVVEEIKEAAIKKENKNIEAAQKFDKKIPEKKNKEREIRKIDNRTDAEGFNEGALKLLER